MAWREQLLKASDSRWSGLAKASSNDCSLSRTLVPPVLLSVIMAMIGGGLAGFAHLKIGALFLPYFSTAAACSLLAVLIVIFIEVAKLARSGAPQPIPKIVQLLLPRAPLLLLPVLALPLFLVGFTASKSAIPFLVGYSWDLVWANVDRLIFGRGGWRIAHSIFGSGSLWFWQWFYTIGWGGAFFFIAATIPLYARRSFVGTYFTAMFATWLIGGCLLAYAFSAAGPVFAHLFDPALNTRFEPLQEMLATSLGNGPVGVTQRYLASAVNSHVAVKGGGISAMPSMHLAAVAIYVLASRGTRWFIPCLVFWLIIFIGSAYFGYHYWVDDIVGAIVAIISWILSSRLYRPDLANPEWPRIRTRWRLEPS